MVKTADFRDLDHRSPIWWLHGARLRRVLVQRQVRPRSVIVFHVAPHNSPQVRFPEYDHMIETLPAQGANYSLRVRVLPGTVRRNDNFLDVERLDPVPKRQPVHTIPVSDQVTRRLSIADVVGSKRRAVGGARGSRVPAQSGAAGWSESERAAAESSGSCLGSVGSRGTESQPYQRGRGIGEGHVPLSLDCLIASSQS
jgi:hypothetical protein